ncbi:MAG TPA: hypothetical protein VGF22_23220 [Acidimicrobiales bacterium]
MNDPLTSKLTWPDDVDAIIGGDLTVGLAYVTPAGGTVLSAVAPIGIHDREAGTVGFTTSLGFGRKLDRIARDPKVALAYHTREHGFATQPGVVVVQGTATVVPSTEELRDELTAKAERFLGPLKRGRFWDRWLQAYYDDRVLVTVRADRILSWPDEVATGEPAIIGPPLPAAPPQSPPKKGTASRVDVAKAARKLTPSHRLLGWQGGDGYPVIVPLRATGGFTDYLWLRAGGEILPSGGRRVGVLAHEYRPQLVGLRSAHALGWLDATEGGEGRFYPHTMGGFAAPPNKTLLLLANGFLARRGLRQAAKAGRTVPTPPTGPM